MLPDPYRRPGFREAERRTLDTILARAKEKLGDEVRYTEIDGHDLILDRHLTLAALATPTRDWHVALGEMRPQRWWNLIGRWRFRRRVDAAKATLQAALYHDVQREVQYVRRQSQTPS